MDQYSFIKDKLRGQRYKWLITGVSGFIGSNLLQELLSLDQTVIGLDNFSTGKKINLIEVSKEISTEQWKNFSFIEADICDFESCRKATHGIDFVLHQAALGSVPRSLENPISSNSSNVNGFLNMLYSSMQSEVSSFTYAASSSTYGDIEDLPKVEDNIGKPLSPYAVTKYVNELYAEVFADNYSFKSIGLRYFNVFGKRQDPYGAYAAVIPKWISSMIKGDKIYINGDGSTSRDFCYVDNVIQANILSALATEKNKNNIFNVAFNQRTSLVDLFTLIKKVLNNHGINYTYDPIFLEFRKGDVLHSQADISKAKKLLSYDPNYSLEEGLSEVVPWYIEDSKS